MTSAYSPSFNRYLFIERLSFQSRLFITSVIRIVRTVHLLPFEQSCHLLGRLIKTDCGWHLASVAPTIPSDYWAIFRSILWLFFQDSWFFSAMVDLYGSKVHLNESFIPLKFKTRWIIILDGRFLSNRTHTSAFNKSWNGFGTKSNYTKAKIGKETGPNELSFSLSLFSYAAIWSHHSNDHIDHFQLSLKKYVCI